MNLRKPPDDSNKVFQGINLFVANLFILYPLKTKGFLVLLGGGGVKHALATKWLKSYVANVPILYSLKTPKNQRFSGV